MKAKWILAAVVAAAGLLLAGCAEEKISVGKIIDKVNAQIKGELNLTPEQNAKLLDFTDTIKKEMADNKAANQGKDGEFYALIEAPQLDQAKIRAWAKAGAEKAAQNTDAKLDIYLPKLAAFHDSLTPEQLKKASAWFKAWESKFTL